jgi:hypothetical protein
MRILHACLAIAAIGAMAARPRLASAGPPIVLESFEGERPDDADTWLEPVLAELTRRGFVTGVALTAAIDRQSRPAGELSASQTLEAKSHVDRAYDHLIEGEYPAAVAEAQKAVDLYAAGTAAVAREAALRDLEFRALIILARAHEAAGDAEDAFRAMSEAIRSFPDRPVNTTEFDPRVKDLQRRVQQALAKQGTGALDLKVDDPAAVLFVNERFTGTGAAHLDNLPAGTYRVFVLKGAQPGRVRDVVVNPGETASRALTWETESTLRSDGGHVGLRFPRGAGTDREIAVATRVARDLGASAVVVLGLRPVEDRRAVVGYSVQIASQTRAYGAVQIEPVGPAHGALPRLGALLGGDKHVDTTSLVLREPAPRPRLGDRRGPVPPWYRDRIGWALVGTGAALLAGGGVTLWTADGLRADANAEPRETARAHLRDRADTRALVGDIVTAAGAAVVIGGAIKLAWTDGPRESSAPVARTHLVFGIGSIALAGSF